MHPLACTLIFVVVRIAGVSSPTLVTVLRPVHKVVLDLQLTPAVGFAPDCGPANLETTKRAFRLDSGFRVTTHLIRMIAVGCTPDRVAA